MYIYMNQHFGPSDYAGKYLERSSRGKGCLDGKIRLEHASHNII